MQTYNHLVANLPIRRYERKKYFPHRPVAQYRYLKDVYQEFFYPEVIKNNKMLEGATYKSVIDALEEPKELINRVQVKYDELNEEYEKKVDQWRRDYPNEAAAYDINVVVERNYINDRLKKKAAGLLPIKKDKITQVKQSVSKKRVDQAMEVIKKSSLPDSEKQILLEILKY